ncbi:uncharacterized protein TrAtP1_001479 [Trichoderma atroviride]|uniref:uncharacterized protein n=1 Tax=Hypocrea atroviridis TaxID=63577 RepID=UPI00331A5772|nr:hypothetical protein TrAtP1_001479 [Trichoderma atroviride]
MARKAGNPETEKPAGSPQKNCPAKSSLESPHATSPESKADSMILLGAAIQIQTHRDRRPRLLSAPASLHSAPLSFPFFTCFPPRRCALCVESRPRHDLADSPSSWSLATSTASR